MNREKKRKTECINSKYKFLPRCLVFQGYDCIKLDGNKIPVMNCVSEARVIPIQKPSGFKSYFMEFVPEVEMDL